MSTRASRSGGQRPSILFVVALCIISSGVIVVQWPSGTHLPLIARLANASAVPPLCGSPFSLRFGLCDPLYSPTREQYARQLAAFRAAPPPARSPLCPSGPDDAVRIGGLGPGMRNNFPGSIGRMMDTLGSCPVPCSYQHEWDSRSLVLMLTDDVSDFSREEADALRDRGHRIALFRMEAWPLPLHHGLDLVASHWRGGDVQVEFFRGGVSGCRCGSFEECATFSDPEERRREFCVATDPPPALSSFEHRENGELVLGSFFVSNCGNVVTGEGRRELLRLLSKRIPLHSYGRCLHNKDSDAPKLDVIDQYPFYISFESVPAEDFVTEKFHQGFVLRRSIMVYLGPPDIESRSPAPRSFINALDFPTVDALATHLRAVASNQTLFDSYFAWKSLPIADSYKQHARRAFSNDPGERNSLCRVCTAARDKFCADPATSGPDGAAHAPTGAAGSAANGKA